MDFGGAAAVEFDCDVESLNFFERGLSKEQKHIVLSWNTNRNIAALVNG
jgi:hypothetical protein